jgi:hypothetical protein
VAVESGAGSITAGLFVATALMILVRQLYPRWWFDFAVELGRFGTRVMAYLLLLTDRHASTTEAQTVHFEVAYPDVERDLNRWFPLIKWLLAIPQFVVLAVLRSPSWWSPSLPGSCGAQHHRPIAPEGGGRNGDRPDQGGDAANQ